MENNADFDNISKRNNLSIKKFQNRCKEMKNFCLVKIMIPVVLVRIELDNLTFVLRLIYIIRNIGPNLRNEVRCWCLSRDRDLNIDTIVARDMTKLFALPTFTCVRTYK